MASSGNFSFLLEGSCGVPVGNRGRNASFGRAIRSMAVLGGKVLVGSPKDGRKRWEVLRATGERVEGSGGENDGRLHSMIAKSKEVLAKQQSLLEKIAERKKIVSSIQSGAIEIEEDATSDEKGSSFAKLSTNNGRNLDTSSRFSKSKNPQIPMAAENQEPSDSSNIKNSIYIGKTPENVAENVVELLEDSGLGSAKAKVLPPLFSTIYLNSTIKDKKDGRLDRSALSSVETKQIDVPDDKKSKPPPLAGVNVMNIILVAAECAPWVKTGGLGDVAGALPKALARRGHRVMVVLPRYGNYSEPKETGIHKRYRVDGQDMEVSYFHAYIDGVDFVFLESGVFRGRESNIYGGERVDILKRMILLCKASVEVPWHVPCGGVVYGDGNLVFIANDWHTALLPVYLKAYYRDHGYMKYTRSILVIHNIAHQGRGPLEDFKLVDLPENHRGLFALYDPVGGEHLNVFAAGIRTADRVVTVSHGYAWEIKTPEGGWGLQRVISENYWKVRGIVNGVDTDEWSPNRDIHLTFDGYANYSLDTFKQGKLKCKSALQRELGLPVRIEVPVIGFIGRLDPQKGVDLIAEAVPWIVGQDAQLVMLGSGRQDLEEMLRRFEWEHHDKVRGWVGFSVKMAHRITAGADVLLMPSRFEPCGLNQMYAMAYGTVPVVHAVGGLRDTVEQFNPFGADGESGHGWTFDSADSRKLVEALGHCLNTYRNYRESWEGIQTRGMTRDLSWENAAKQYEEVLISAKYQW